jgi:hypothetical protein
VVSPIRENTAVGRHIERHGDSGYMLILQTDDLARAETRLNQLSVRIVWRAAHPDISAMHLHPKDIGGALVSIDEAKPAQSWRWAGPNWQQYVASEEGQHVRGVTLFAREPEVMSHRWAQVLGTDSPVEAGEGFGIEIDDGSLEFVRADTDVIAGFRISTKRPRKVLEAARSQGLFADGNSMSICGVRFEVMQASA